MATQNPVSSLSICELPVVVVFSLHDDDHPFSIKSRPTTRSGGVEKERRKGWKNRLRVSNYPACAYFAFETHPVCQNFAFIKCQTTPISNNPTMSMISLMNESSNALLTPGSNAGSGEDVRKGRFSTAIKRMDRSTLGKGEEEEGG